MALTDKQRSELEALGVAVVQTKLAQPGPGRGASLRGFASGDMARGDVEDWLSEAVVGHERLWTEQHAEAVHWAKVSGKWARIAGLAALAAVALAIIVPVVQWATGK